MRRRGVTVACLLLVVAWSLVPPPAGAVQSDQDLVVSADPVDWTPHVLDGTVRAFVQVGNRIIVGGTFATVRNAGTSIDIPRQNVFAYDATTGKVDLGFAPAVNGTVNGLAADGTSTGVYLGGSFSTVNGVASRGLAKLSASSGLAVPEFSAVTNGTVADLVVRGNRMYVGGYFSQIGGQSRSNLAAVDTVSGAVDPNLNLPVTAAMIGATANVLRLDVTPDRSKLVLIGNFTQVAGQPRTQVAVVRLGAPATVSPWATSEYGNNCNVNYYTYMRDVDISRDGTYMAIVTTGSTTTTTKLCDTTTRWDLTVERAEKLPAWVDYTGNDSLLSVAVTDAAVYVGGHQRWQNNSSGKDVAGPGAVARSGVAALDPLTGVPLSWNPGRDRGYGAGVLVATDTGLLIGSDTTSLGGEYHARLGFFPLAGGTPNPAPVPVVLPAEVYAASTTGVLSGRTYNGSAFGSSAPVSGPAQDGIDWNGTRGAFMVNGTVYVAAPDGRLLARAFDGDNFGPAQDLVSWVDWSAMTALAYYDGRLLYIKASLPSVIYSRRFSIESGIIGSQEYVASGPTQNGINWSGTVGLTVIGGRLYSATSGGNLRRTDLVDWKPVAGTTVTVSGPGVDTLNWSGTVGLFAGPVSAAASK